MGKWKKLPKLKYPRCQPFSTLIHLKLYVMGGYSLKPKEPIMEIELFDTEKLKWEEYNFLMLPPVYGFATVSINPLEFIVLGGKTEK